MQKIVFLFLIYPLLALGGGSPNLALIRSPKPAFNTLSIANSITCSPQIISNCIRSPIQQSQYLKSTMIIKPERDNQRKADFKLCIEIFEKCPVTCKIDNKILAQFTAMFKDCKNTPPGSEDTSDVYPKDIKYTAYNGYVFSPIITLVHFDKTIESAVEIECAITKDTVTHTVPMRFTFEYGCPLLMQDPLNNKQWICALLSEISH